MKNIKSIIIPIVALFGITACNSSQGGETCTHSYTGSEQIINEDQSVDTNNHYVVCYDCNHKTKQAHTFDQQVASPTYLKSEASCNQQAKYYKSCECGLSSKGISGKETTFSSGLLKEHTITSLTLVNSPSKLSYQSYDKVDPTGIRLVYACSHCGGGELTANDDITFLYESGNSSFRMGETKVTAYYQGFSVDIPNVVVTPATNAILNLEDCSIKCSDELPLGKIKAQYGELSILVKDCNDKVVSPDDYEEYDPDLSPFTITATATSSINYTSASKSAVVTVNHNFENDASLGTTSCKNCKKDAISKVFYDLSTSSVEVCDAAGSYKSLVSANNIYSASTNELLSNPTATAGSNILCYVVNPSNSEKVYFNVKAATKCIHNEQEFNESVWCESRLVRGYYVIVNDIAKITSTTATIAAPVFNSTASFLGELDGNNHIIDEVVITNGNFGLFGTTVHQIGGERPLFTNLVINKVTNGRLFGYQVKQSTFKKCKISYSSGDCLMARKLICQCYFDECTFDMGCGKTPLFLERSTEAGCDTVYPSTFNGCKFICHEDWMIFGNQPDIKAGVDNSYSGCKYVMCEGHEYGAWQTVTPSTCKTEGSAIRYCSENECTYSQTKTLPLADHSLQPVNAVSATSTNAGHPAGYVCTVCGQHLNENKENVSDDDWYINIPQATLIEETAFYDLSTKSVDKSELNIAKPYEITNAGGEEISSFGKYPGDTGYAYTVIGGEFKKLNLLYVSKVIKTAEDFQSLKCEVGSKSQSVEELTKTGYYVLGNDINTEVLMATTTAEVNSYLGLAASTAVNGTNGLAYNSGHQWSCTLDGRGHSISKINDSTMYYISMFGGQVTNATIKDISFGFKTGWGANGGNYYGSIFGIDVRSLTVDNVNIKVYPATGTIMGVPNMCLFGLYAYEGIVINNVNVDFNNNTLNGTGAILMFTQGRYKAATKPVVTNLTVSNISNGNSCYFFGTYNTSVPAMSGTAPTGMAGWVRG